MSERGPRALPAGVVTFAFSDIEGSTHLLQRLGDRYAELLGGYLDELRAAFGAAGGLEFGNEGDGMFFVFEDGAQAIAGALDAQRRVAARPWPEGVDLRVRMGLHTGEVTLTSMGTYVGLPLHAAARICAATHGAQVVVSDSTRLVALDRLPDGASLADLGHHRLKDLPDPLHLFQLVHPALRTDFPRLRSDAVPGNLPRQITSFIGRAAEVEGAVDALRRGASLVTLTGPGGAGKTRLALEVAAEVVDAYPHGAWLVELAAVTEPGNVARTIAATLELREEPARSIDQSLVEGLRERRVLLILDNCEHLVGEVAEVAAAVLRACAGVQVLATSQEALGVLGEVVAGVPPLRDADAVALFEDRAALHRPGFHLEGAALDAARKICRRLDGIPLAIELAAARTTVLTPQQIAERLDDQFRLLTGGSRAVLPRQRTLRATVEWSHDLLGDDERVLFRRLAVFAGGWTLEAAEKVCGFDTLEGDVLDVLARLVSRSLVVVSEQDMAARYRFLEPIRQFALERAVEQGEVAEVRTRHRAWYARLVAEAEPALSGRDQQAWLARLDVEYDNIRAAMEWAAAHPSGGDVLVAMAAGLWRFWLVRGEWSEGRDWLARALDANPAANTPLRAAALAAAGDLATEQSDFEVALPLLEECLSLYRDLGDSEGTAKALNHLGNLARARFDYDTARAHLTDALAIRRATGSRRGMAVSLRNLGMLAALQRDFDTARTLYREALPLARASGDSRVVATLTASLAAVTFTDGEHEEARRLSEEGLALSRALGDRQAMAEHLTVLAAVAGVDGDTGAGTSLAQEALSLWRSLGVRDAVGRFHTTMGELMSSAGLLDDARAHLSKALAAWRRLGDQVALTRVATLAGQAAFLLGDLDEAEPLLREVDEITSANGDDAQRAAALHELGDVARCRGDLAFAQRLYEQSLELAQKTGWKRLLWGPVQGLGTLARLRGDAAEAMTLLARSIALRPSLGRRLGTAACLDEVAAVLHDLGDDDSAARLLGAAAALREEIRAPIPPVRRADHEAVLVAVGQALGAERLGHAMAEGSVMSIDAAVALATSAAGSTGARGGVGGTAGTD